MAQPSSSFQTTKPSALRNLLGGLWRAKAAPKQHDNSSPQAAVSDAEAVTPIDPLEAIHDSGICYIARTQQFLQSSAAAKQLIDKARSVRQECLYRKGAAEHAVHHYGIDLEFCLEETTRTRILSNLQRNQHELDDATQWLARCDRDLSVVSRLLERAGYPTFPLETTPARFPLQIYVTDEDDPDEHSGSSCCEE